MAVVPRPCNKPRALRIFIVSRTIVLHYVKEVIGCYDGVIGGEGGQGVGRESLQVQGHTCSGSTSESSCAAALSCSCKAFKFSYCGLIMIQQG